MSNDERKQYSRKHLVEHLNAAGAEIQAAPGTPEDYKGSWAYIVATTPFGPCRGRRTGIEAFSAKAVYELVDFKGNALANSLFVIDQGVLIPVETWRSNLPAAERGEEA